MVNHFLSFHSNFSVWTNKSREKAVRVEKEIVMLRQLLDEGLRKEAVSYLTLVSDCLREIEKVIDIFIHCSKLSELKYAKIFDDSNN